MFVDHGLSPIEIATLISAWCATTIILEVPSGVLADRHSRKAIMVFGAVLRAGGYTCWALFPEFWGFLVGFVLWGIEGALGSGAFEALVYDELKRFGRQDEYARVMGRCRGLGQAGIVVSAAAASTGRREPFSQPSRGAVQACSWRRGLCTRSRLSWSSSSSLCFRRLMLFTTPGFKPPFPASTGPPRPR